MLSNVSQRAPRGALAPLEDERRSLRVFERAFIPSLLRNRESPDVQRRYCAMKLVSREVCRAMRFEYEANEEEINELTALASSFELLMDGMRDKVSAINQRVHALSDDFDVLLPNDDPAAQS